MYCLPAGRPGKVDPAQRGAGVERTRPLAPLVQVLAGGKWELGDSALLTGPSES